MDKSAVEAIVAARLPGYVAAMGLQGWRIEVRYERIEDSAATCQTNINYDKATIRIDPAHPDHATEAGVLDSLRHELFHVILAPFDVWEWRIHADTAEGSPERRKATDDFIHANERCVVALERLWQGMDAYRRACAAPDLQSNGEPIMSKIKHGYSKSSIGHNIGEMVKAGKGRKQAVAAALNIAREAADKAGKPARAPAKPKRRKKAK